MRYTITSSPTAIAPRGPTAPSPTAVTTPDASIPIRIGRGMPGAERTAVHLGVDRVDSRSADVDGYLTGSRRFIGDIDDGKHFGSSERGGNDGTTHPCCNRSTWCIYSATSMRLSTSTSLTVTYRIWLAAAWNSSMALSSSDCAVSSKSSLAT